jgi:sugar O-acyltransferase (sialic acid O-acetyltransferase NeuD family)
VIATALARDQDRELYMAGSGSFAVEIADWAGDAGWEVRGLIELLDPARVGGATDGHPVVALQPPAGNPRAVVAAGGSRDEHWSTIERLGWGTATIVHPSAHVSSTATLAAGCVVGPGAVVGAMSAIGPHTLISRGTLVGHHCRIEGFVSLMPGANLGGHVRVGERSTVGMAAVVVNGGMIGRGATVAAGAVVLGEVAQGARVQGVPAREYRR